MSRRACSCGCPGAKLEQCYRCRWGAAGLRRGMAHVNNISAMAQAMAQTVVVSLTGRVHERETVLSEQE
jgi:hypothetical protein